MASKTMTIAFLQGGIIPAAVLSLAKDLHCDALEPVEVPDFYGKSLIQDRIAIPAEMPAAVSEKTKEPASRRNASKSKETTSAPTQSQPDTSAETLLGSNVLPSMVEIVPGKEIQLGSIVAMAHEKSGLSIEDWNAQADADREALLAATVEELKAAETSQQP